MQEEKWTREEKLRRIVQVAERGVGSQRQHIGIELEHFIIDRDTKKRVFYEGPRGVREILEEIARQPGFSPVRSGGHILGVHAPLYELSIEPGAQFEISVAHDASILVLRERYQEALTRICPVLEKRNLTLLTLGLDPFFSVEEIPLIPKDRYRVMDEQLQKRGGYARTMMRQSCALQVSLDYEDEADFVRKYRVLSAMSPIFYTLFDSAAYLGGERIPHFNMRQEVWRAVDSQRCGIVPGTFDADFGFSAYAAWVLQIPPLFLPEAEDAVRQTGDRTLEDLLDEVPVDRREALIAHALSIVFPDVRLKTFLEVRMMDEVPAHLAFAAAALLKGLLYHPSSLATLEEWFAPATESMVERGKNSGRDHGIQGYYFSDYFAHWGLRLIELAQAGLESEEAALLQDLSEMWGNLDTPRSIFERIEKKEGLCRAVEGFEVEPGCQMRRQWV